MKLMKNARLAELQFLSCELESVDAFAQLYARMIEDCKLANDTVTARAMQQILMKQACFLLNAWLEEKKPMSPSYVEGYGYGGNN